jgi:hypothetical protein
LEAFVKRLAIVFATARFYEERGGLGLLVGRHIPIDTVTAPECEYSEKVVVWEEVMWYSCTDK